MPRCKQCKEKFEPKYFNQKFCMIKDKCILAHVELSKDLQRKQWKKKKKELKESLKTHKDYLKELQTVFNKFIRIRDIEKGCISCGKSLKGSKFDAGHFYSVGSSPSVRFNEDNVHGQCVYCNQHLHGNIHNYTEKLTLRIGLKRFNQLKIERNKTTKLTIEDLKELKEYYKEKIKNMS